jgi:predicted permease
MKPHMRSGPPRLARWLVLLVVPAEVAAQIDGDLREGFRFRLERDGVLRARLWYWRQLCSLDVVRLRREFRRRVEHRTQVLREARASRHLGQDLRYAVRTLRRNPGFALVVLATLALGIGATTAIFTAVNSVLFRPLPYPDSHRLVMVFRTIPRLGFTRSTVSYPDFADWRAQTEHFEALGAYAYTTATYLGDEGAEQWIGYRVTSDLLRLLEVPPAIGRTFTASDDRPGAEPVILLSHGVWQSRFGGDAGIVGRRISLNDERHLVIGVMPPSFAFPSRTAAFWVPLRGDAERMERDTNFLSVIGRMAPGVRIAEVRSEMDALATRIDATAPAANQGYGIYVESRHAFVVRNARTALVVFFGAVGLVLVIACINVANLMLARGTTRRREMAVRTALGAGRRRLVRQLLVESAVLAAVGGLLGTGVAAGLLRLLVTLGPRELPRMDTIGIDPAALAFTAALSLGCGIAFGIVPAVLGTGGDVRQSLKEGGHAAGSGTLGRRVQQGFVVSQVALAMVLTVGAGLLINSFVRLTSVEPGFDPHNVVAARVAPPAPRMASGMSEDEMLAMARAVAETRAQFFDQLLQRIAGLPGVQSAGLTYGLPFSPHSFSRVVVPEGKQVEPGDEPVINGDIIGGDYLATMGIVLLQGRGFASGDRMGAPSVALVNEVMADLFWPGESALGKRIRLGEGDGPWTTVVGVVSDVRRQSLAEEREPIYYRPLRQAGWPQAMFVAVRSVADPAELVPALRREVWALDARIPLTDIATAAELVEESIAGPRFRMLVLSTFGALALLLAVVGIYGVIAYAVGERTREIGIRLALGAEQQAILRMVLGHGMGLAAIGLSIGAAGAVALTRFLASMLFGVTPQDPVTFAAVVVVLLAASGLACYVPARRAAKIDPMESLQISDF